MQGLWGEDWGGPCPGSKCPGVVAQGASWGEGLQAAVRVAWATLQAPGGAPTRRLFHAAAQHLVGRDEHDTDDEGDGKGADQALAHARLADLLVGTGCSRPPGTPGKETKGDNERMESDLHLGKRT